MTSVNSRGLFLETSQNFNWVAYVVLQTVCNNFVHNFINSNYWFSLYAAVLVLTFALSGCPKVEASGMLGVAIEVLLS